MKQLLKTFGAALPLVASIPTAAFAAPRYEQDSFQSVPTETAYDGLTLYAEPIVEPMFGAYVPAASTPADTLPPMFGLIDSQSERESVAAPTGDYYPLDVTSPSESASPVASDTVATPFEYIPGQRSFDAQPMQVYPTATPSEAMVEPTFALPLPAETNPIENVYIPVETGTYSPSPTVEYEETASPLPTECAGSPEPAGEGCDAPPPPKCIEQADAERGITLSAEQLSQVSALFGPLVAQAKGLLADYQDGSGGKVGVGKEESDAKVLKIAKDLLASFKGFQIPVRDDLASIKENVTEVAIILHKAGILFDLGTMRWGAQFAPSMTVAQFVLVRSALADSAPNPLRCAVHIGSWGYPILGADMQRLPAQWSPGPNVPSWNLAAVNVYLLMDSLIYKEARGLLFGSKTPVDFLSLLWPLDGEKLNRVDLFLRYVDSEVGAATYMQMLAAKYPTVLRMNCSYRNVAGREIPIRDVFDLLVTYNQTTVLPAEGVCARLLSVALGVEAETSRYVEEAMMNGAFVPPPQGQPNRSDVAKIIMTSVEPNRCEMMLQYLNKKLKPSVDLFFKGFNATEAAGRCSAG